MFRSFRCFFQPRQSADPSRPRHAAPYAPGVSGALVTGAGRGLGLEIAQALADRGLTVHVTDVDADGGQGGAPRDRRRRLRLAARRARRRRLPGRRRRTVERAGSLDVWVNNAGILVTGHVWEQTPRCAAAVRRQRPRHDQRDPRRARADARGRTAATSSTSSRWPASAPRRARRSTRRPSTARSPSRLGTLADLRREGVKGIHVSAVCPDGIWTPMLYDRLDDPDAAPSFSGTLLRPEEVAPKVAALLDRPPRRARDPALARRRSCASSTPSRALAARLLPLFLADARAAPAALEEADRGRKRSLSTPFDTAAKPGKFVHGRVRSSGRSEAAGRSARTWKRPPRGASSLAGL